MSYHFVKHLLFGVLALALTACTIATPFDKKLDGCIDSFYTYAYTVPSESEILKEGVIPSSPWTVVSSLPAGAVPNVSAGDDAALGVAFTRSKNSYTEVWVAKLRIDPQANRFRVEYFVYHTDTSQWETVSGQVSTEVFVNIPFVAPDGSLWGSTSWDPRSEVEGVPVLSRFNETTQRFEFVKGVEEIPSVWNSPDQQQYVSSVLMDASGVFWIFASEDAIYSYDPITGIVQREASLAGIIIRNVQLAPDGTFFVRNYLGLQNSELQEGELLKFDPNTGELETIAIPGERWPQFGQILVDHTGRLWLDTVGWREPDGNWHRMYPDPNQYFWKVEVDDDYRWATPNVFMESSNGYIWYQNDKGIAWFDPATESGCWLTNLAPSIVEDQEKVLWLLIGENLYQNVLNN